MNNTKELVSKYNIRLTKSLGQNFLIDDTVVVKIVDAADVNERDLVIEVGPGTGSMTRYLAERAGRVVAVEIDKHLIPVLKDNLAKYSNVEIINSDILSTDIYQLVADQKKQLDSGSVKVVANLPYYITTPIIMKFLEENPGIDTMIFMVQKEVAERMAAKPGGKEDGALSVAVQYYSAVSKALEVPPHCFIPQPEVDSTVVRMNVYKNPPVEIKSRECFFKTVKASFGQRRKTLVNALHNSGFFKEDKEAVKVILETMGIKENIRGEALSIQQFAILSNLLTER